MDRHHKVIHFINMLIILLLLLFLVNERVEKSSVYEDKISPDLTPRVETVLPQIYPPDKRIVIPSDAMLLPWTFEAPGEVPDKKGPVAPSPKRSRLKVEQQKELFYELSFLEFKAVHDGMVVDPGYGKKYITYVYRWNSIYRDAVKEKYNISSKHLEQIYKKGINQRWPIYGD